MRAREGDLSVHANSRRNSVVKVLIATGAVFAFVSAASAADLPHPQPVPAYPAPAVGKMPIGKSPVGKAPIGKAPAPVVTKY
jgi:hypothetical protein